MLVLKVRFGYTKVCSYKSTKILQRLCRSFHLKMTGSSCKDDARVKVPSFQKVTFSSTILNIPQRCYPIVFCFKMLLAAVV